MLNLFIILQILPDFWSVDILQDYFPPEWNEEVNNYDEWNEEVSNYNLELNKEFNNGMSDEEDISVSGEENVELLPESNMDQILSENLNHEENQIDSTSMIISEPEMSDEISNYMMPDFELAPNAPLSVSEIYF